jgi:hypothetical protein
VATVPARTDWSKIDTVSAITNEPTPSADRELLALAEYFVRAVATTPYANAGKFFDGATFYDTSSPSDGTIDQDNRIRHLTQVFAPATKLARYYVGRFGAGTATQTATEVSGQEGGLTVYSKTASPASGENFFGQIDRRGDWLTLSGCDGSGGVAQSGTETPGVSGSESYVAINESLLPTPSTKQLFIINRAGSFSFFVPREGQSSDLEVL